MPKKHSRELYKAARTVNDLETLASGDLKKAARRAKNKLPGRLFISKGDVKTDTQLTYYL